MPPPPPSQNAPEFVAADLPPFLGGTWVGEFQRQVVVYEGGNERNLPKIHAKISALGITPPKINMEHNNAGLEGDFPFQIGDL